MGQSIISLSEFKAKAARLLSNMKAEEHTIILTQNGAANAVVQDYQSYQRTSAALLLLKLMVQGEADVAKGRETSQDRVFADLRAHLTENDGP